MQKGSFIILYVDSNNNTLRVNNNLYPTYLYNSSDNGRTYFVPLVDTPFGSLEDPFMSNPRTTVIGTYDAFTKSETYINYHQVTFTEPGPLGLNFTPDSWPAIESIDASSLAIQQGLRAGMVVVEIQGQDIRGKTAEEAFAVLRSAGRPVRMTFVPEYDETSTSTYIATRFVTAEEGETGHGDTLLARNGNHYLKLVDPNIPYYVFLDPIMLEFMRRLNIQHHTIPQTIVSLYNRSGYVGMVTRKVSLNVYDKHLFIHCYAFLYRSGYGVSFFVNPNFRHPSDKEGGFFNGYRHLTYERNGVNDDYIQNVSQIILRPNNFILMLKWMVSSICLLMISSAQCFFCWDDIEDDSNLFLHTIDATSSILKADYIRGTGFRGNISVTLMNIKKSGGITLDEYDNLSAEYINSDFKIYDKFMFCNLTCGFINLPLFTKDEDEMRRQYINPYSQGTPSYNEYKRDRKEYVIEINYDDLNTPNGDKIQLATELFEHLLQHVNNILVFIDQLILIYNDVLLRYLKQYIVYRYKWLIKLRNDIFETNCIDLPGQDGKEWRDPPPLNNNCKVYERNPHWCKLRADTRVHCCICGGGQRGYQIYKPIPQPPSEFSVFFEEDPALKISCASLPTGGATG